MKKFSFILIVVAIFMLCVGCSNDTVAEDEKGDVAISTNDVVETIEGVEVTEDTDTSIENSTDILVKEVNNAQEICEYLNFMFEAVEFEVKYEVTDYYDDFFSMDVDEYAYISGVNEDAFEMISATVAFVDGKIIDFTLTLNTEDEFDIDKYENTMNIVCSLVGYNLGHTKSEVADIVSNFYDFSKYEANEYGNEQTEFLVNTTYCVGIVFEGGKDFEYEGTTYYLIISPAI